MTFYILWIIATIISIILFIRGLASSTFLSMRKRDRGSEIWSRGREHIVLRGEYIDVQNDIFKEIRTWASRRRLSEISRFNIPRHAAYRALFPENAFSARVDSCEGVAISGGAWEPQRFTTQTVSLRDQFANSTNVDDKRRGKGRGPSVEGSVGWIEGARVSGALKERGCFERVASSTARQQGQRPYTSN